MQISPVIVNGFEKGFHRCIQRIFLVVLEAKKIVLRIFFLKVGSIYGPVAAKPLVLELLCLKVGTSVASAGTAETILEIMNVCVMSICVAACAWGQNRKFSGFSILATPTIEIFRFFDVMQPE